jgi:flagellar motor switch protein FliM
MGRESLQDIPRSDALNAGQLQSLRTLHESTPHAFGAALATLLRNPVEIRLAGVDQLTYGQFVHGLDDPSYFSVLKADPLHDRVLLDVDLTILYPMLDRMLGGGHADEPAPHRPPSDIERPLAARIVRLFLEHLQQAWQSALPLRFELLQAESHPRLLRVLPSDETVALLTFAVTIGNRQGFMRLCFPCRALRQIGDKSGNLVGPLQSSSAAEGAETPADNAAGTPGVELVVTIATTTIAASDLQSLQVGDIILTETAADSPATVSIDGQLDFHGQPGVCDGRKAVVLSDASPDAGSQDANP